LVHNTHTFLQFHLKSFSNSNSAGVMPSECSSGSRGAHTKGSGSIQNNNNNHSKKKRSRRRRKPKCHNKVEPASKKQHDAPMTKRDLYFSLACEVVRTAEDDSNGGNSLAVARVTIVNWDMEVVLDTFVKVPVPVVDLMGTGITAADIHENPQAMMFTTVRETVERILCGKILIGYQLCKHLSALGLSHPSTDVRDASFYVGSVEEEERSIEDLAEEILERSLPDRSERHRSIEVCIAALDLYKANRKEWELKLIERARESEQQSLHEMATAANRQQMSYAAPQVPVPQTQSQDMMYPMRQLPPHQQDFSQQATVPTNYLPAAASHPYGPGAYLSHSLQQQQAMMMAARNPASTQARNNSSWFSLGRKARPPQQPPVMSMTSTAQASLSSQALEALSFPNSSFDYYDGSSAYDGSTGYDRSTDHASSARYEGSVVSESVGSVVSESVESSYQDDSENVESSYQDDSENIPAGGDFENQARQQASENSSWFRFGSRKSRYAPEQREPMTVVQESNEPEETSFNPEDLEPEFTDDARLSNYDAARYESGISEDKKHSSSWFGFKRSKSPGVGKKEKSEDAVDFPEEADPAGETELQPSDAENAPATENENETETETVTAKVEAPATEKQSSWFKFGRRSSMRSKSPSVDIQLQDDNHPVDEVVTLHTESSEATDEDWWQEVMNQPGNNLTSEDMDTQSTQELMNQPDNNLKSEDMDTQSTQSSQKQWMGEKPSGNLTSDGQSLEQSGSQSSTWFRFLRSPKVSSLQDASPMKKEETEGSLEQPSQSDSFDGNGEAWIGDAASSFDRSCLGPAWYGPADQQSEAGEIVTFSPHFKEMDFNGLLAPRARLHTESTIPSVATEPEEFEEFSQEFVQGMEKNLTFLNI
jgi:RNA exonuclease 4